MRDRQAPVEARASNLRHYHHNGLEGMYIPFVSKVSLHVVVNQVVVELPRVRTGVNCLGNTHFMDCREKIGQASIWHLETRLLAEMGTSTSPEDLFIRKHEATSRKCFLLH